MAERTPPLVLALALAALGAACESTGATAPAPSRDGAPPTERSAGVKRDVTKTDAEWRSQLSADQYRVLRESGTERAFTGKYWNHHAKGTYRCAGCGASLFDADTKFDSGSGWPSYYQPVTPAAVEEHSDTSHGMRRTEVVCRRCGGHLGHVFEDGPAPTHLRYCINSASLDFVPAERDAGSDR